MHRQAKQWFFSDPLIKSFEEEPPMPDWVHGQGQCSKRSSLSRYSNHEKSFSNGLIYSFPTKNFETIQMACSVSKLKQRQKQSPICNFDLPLPRTNYWSFCNGIVRGW